MEKINNLKIKLNNYNLDGYLIPKNDEFFSEYVPQDQDKLQYISNFSGSYGLALILKKDRPAFDKIRASINLVVAAILISIATSYKLPLSTTYVTFMVAMGTSLADRAWGSDSATYRVAGVINVIGGWLMTALIAFLASGLIASIIYYFDQYALYLLVLIVAIVLTKNYFTHKPKKTPTCRIKHSWYWTLPTTKKSSNC